MGLLFSSPPTVSNDHGQPFQASSPSGPELLANSETDPDVASAVVSNAIVSTSETIVRFMTSFMNPTTVLDQLPDDPLARQVYEVSPDGSLAPDSSTSPSIHSTSSSICTSSNAISPHEEQLDQYAVEDIIRIENDRGVDADLNQPGDSSLSTEHPPFSDPVDVFMTRVAPKPLVRMLSSSSNTPSTQSERALPPLESTPSIENV